MPRPRRPRNLTPLANALREARIDLRLDQRAMAERLSVSPVTISAWERGRYVPSLDQGKRAIYALRDAPEAVRARIAVACGFPRPGELLEKLAPPPAHPVAADVLRAVADELDLPASSVRKTIALALARFDEAGLGVDALRAAVAVAKKPSK